MTEILNLIYFVGQAISLLALVAGAMMSLMASNVIPKIHPVRPKMGGAPVVEQANQHLHYV